jgi:hypothetical protein
MLARVIWAIKCSGQAFPGAVGPDRRCISRATQDLRCLADRETLPGNEQQQLAVPIAELRQRVRQHMVPGGLGSGRCVVKALLQSRVALGASVLMPEHAPSAAQQPRQRVIGHVL